MEQRPIGFWLRLVDTLIEERFATTLDEHGVTRRQWQLLNVLSRGDADTAELDAAVAPFLSSEEGESSDEHLSELIESEWVVVVDRGYSLTEHGRTAFSGLSGVVQETRDLTTDGLAEEDYARTLATLERMARNLGWQSPA